MKYMKVVDCERIKANMKLRVVDESKMKPTGNRVNESPNGSSSVECLFGGSLGVIRSICVIPR